MTPCGENLFRDPLVNDIKAAGGVLRRGDLTLRLPRVFGFCGGVTRAVRLLKDECAKSAGRDIWLLGPIIHNDAVNAWFRERGVRIASEDAPQYCFEHASPSDCFVIPAFGLPRPVQNQLAEFADSNARIVDTTCPYVARIWDFVERQADFGRTVVIHGKPGHPETNGILSRALRRSNAAVLVPDLEHAAILARAVRDNNPARYQERLCHQAENLDLANMACVSQTTMLYSETERVADLLRSVAEETRGKLQTMNTVCRATQERQDAARELCRIKCDLRIVIGGFDSSNTNRLQTLAANAGPAYFIRDEKAIGENCIRHYDPSLGREASTVNWRSTGPMEIGILAGASCPDGIIGNVIRRLLKS
ncbi:MAG: 4-hydroxy-3-methylbut-2-enyl diphosphate reductase [bacterium]